MVFSSFLFLFLFFPLVAAVYLVTPAALRNLVLLIASVLFYGWGAPQVLPFLLLGCTFDYYVSGWIVPGRVGERARKAVFAAAVIVNLSALLYFKYANFFIGEVSRAVAAFGGSRLSWEAVVLPLGISFFTFHKISYLGDIYRGKVTPSRSIIDYTLYILFFPQLIAGPIIRFADVASQFDARVHSIDDIFEGLVRFCFGLGKKVLIADSLGSVVDSHFALSSSKLGCGPAWIAVVSYSFQIYFDFSGYSDMAIGLARVFGFRFKENFNRPYRALNFTDFWRRWHISLSNFMREYVYIPLGGNRGTLLRTSINLWVTFLLSGLWHGASWNFIVWGAYHGAFLTLDKLGLHRLSEKSPRWIAMSATFILVTVGWVFFRADTLAHAFDILTTMSGLGPRSIPLKPRAFIIDNRGIAMLLVAALVSFAPWCMKEHSDSSERTSSTFHLRMLRAPVALVLFLLSTAALASRGYTPFLYFKF